MLIDLPQLFDLTTSEALVDCFNNIFFNKNRTNGSIASKLNITRNSGEVNFGVNWITEGWENGGGVVNGASNLIEGTVCPVDYVSLKPTNNTSPVIDAAQPIPSALQTDHNVTSHYVKHFQKNVRSIIGSAMDLGAYEFSE